MPKQNEKIKSAWKTTQKCSENIPPEIFQGGRRFKEGVSSAGRPPPIMD